MDACIITHTLYLGVRARVGVHIAHLAAAALAAVLADAAHARHTRGRAAVRLPRGVAKPGASKARLFGGGGDGGGGRDYGRGRKAACEKRGRERGVAEVPSEKETVKSRARHEKPTVPASASMRRSPVPGSRSHASTWRACKRYASSCDAGIEADDRGSGRCGADDGDDDATSGVDLKLVPVLVLALSAT